MSSLPENDRPQGRDEEAADWCLRLFQAPLSPAEQKEFDAWIASPKNIHAFEDAIAIWQSAEAVAEKPEFLHIRAEALESYRRANSRRWSRPLLSNWYVRAGMAAAILLLVMTGWIMLRDPMQLYQTGVGERRIAMLTDGSRLSLDADTKVEVRLRDDGRELRLLSGRAKFDVAHDALRPFRVIAGNKMVVATGTSFSVELLRRQVHVLLYEGHVEVLESPADATKRFAKFSGNVSVRERPKPMQTSPAVDQSLVPGRELITPLATQSAIVVTADLPLSLLWESGQLSFEDEALPSAVERMNRYARQKLVIADKKTASLRVNGVFIAGDTGAFVEGLKALYPIQVTHSNARLILARK
jgi:transmembrane sensor